MTTTEALNLLKELQESTSARPVYHRAIMEAILTLERATQPVDKPLPPPAVESCAT